MSETKTITVEEIVKETAKSLRVKAGGHNYNIHKTTQGWEAFRNFGSSFAVETEESTFQGDNGPVTMTWIVGFSPASAPMIVPNADIVTGRVPFSAQPTGQQRQDSIETQAAIKAALGIVQPIDVASMNPEEILAARNKVQAFVVPLVLHLKRTLLAPDGEKAFDDDIGLADGPED